MRYIDPQTGLATPVETSWWWPKATKIKPKVTLLPNPWRSTETEFWFTANDGEPLRVTRAHPVREEPVIYVSGPDRPLFLIVVENPPLEMRGMIVASYWMGDQGGCAEAEQRPVRVSEITTPQN